MRLGAIIGSYAGPLGTATGAVVGALAGAALGEILYNEATKPEVAHPEAVPELPEGTTGDRGLDSSGKRVNTDLPLGEFEDTVKDLTKNVLEDFKDDGSKRCPNGVIIRPDKGQGPRIDIPAKGDRPHETIHFPPGTPWPFKTP